MKIYTRKGDNGTTQLIGGTRVPKHHLRIEAYGTIDELNSWMGLLRDSLNDEHPKLVLKEIQDRLFTIGSLLASDPESSRMKVPDLHEHDVELLEKEIDTMQEVLPELKTFVLPGGNAVNAMCHIARCVCRRSERLAVQLSEAEKAEPLILKYLNRLSDYLFVLARKISFDARSEELPWKPRL
ncbi:MAG TPA: cob(I)yrinic acid a,c-diamide adenosyltransferase [Chitinophagales bacterium]|nr:cob(I)yrinic acid a,c-diamide adenosyltransferase [Chitinophagales bacterium]